MHDLSHDTFGIQYRLAGEDIIKGSLVDNNLVLVGIKVYRHQLRNQSLLADLERSIEQCAQANVFSFKRSQFLQLYSFHDLLGTQARIFFLQFPA